ncbi:MAG: four helix bundle protein [Syntrophorhabdales bacterium]|jgi:four helix bundle protein
MLKANESAKKNVIQEKSYLFALKIVALCKALRERNEYELAGQLLRAGTSIGANIEEAIGGASRRDFVAKINIACKEARESNYWLRLLRDSDTCPARDIAEIIRDSEELKKILHLIVKTARISET